MNPRQTELQLFKEYKEQTKIDVVNKTNEDIIISGEKVEKSVSHILTEVIPETLSTPTKPQHLAKSLDDLFPEQKYEEKNIKKAKEILGNISDELTTDELRDTVTKIQYLCDTWLNNFEKKIFKGVTLQEILHEKGGK